MTSNSQNRVAPGVPTGGQFAHNTHSEPGVSLLARPDALDGWPVSAPEPDVDFTLGDDGSITTNIKVNGEPVFEVWNPGEDIHSIESSDFECGEIPDPDDYELAKTWAYNKHEEIAGALRTEINDAIIRARHNVLAKATGRPKQLTDDELVELSDANSRAVYDARFDAEHAAAAIISRRTLKDHPTAATIGLQVDSSNNQLYVSGVVVYDEAGQELGDYRSYDRYSDDEELTVEDEQFYDQFSTLGADPDTSHWSSFNPFLYEKDDKYKIDVKKASVWTPGVTA